jgi:hypothetical protein
LRQLPQIGRHGRQKGNRRQNHQRR